MIRMVTSVIPDLSPFHEKTHQQLSTPKTPLDTKLRMKHLLDHSQTEENCIFFFYKNRKNDPKMYVTTEDSK